MHAESHDKLLLLSHALILDGLHSTHVMPMPVQVATGCGDLGYDATNNEAEYQGLIAGLKVWCMHISPEAS